MNLIAATLVWFSKPTFTYFHATCPCLCTEWGGRGRGGCPECPAQSTITQSSIVPCPGQHSYNYISPHLTVTSSSPVDILLKTAFMVVLFDTKYKLVREKGFRIYINYQWIYHTGPSYWTYWIHFDYVPVPEVLDLVANTMECVDHLVQTLEKRYSSLHMIFMQLRGSTIKKLKNFSKMTFSFANTT